MSIYSIVFSPTGGTKKVLNILSKEFGNEECIDLTKSDLDFTSFNLRQDDICMIGVPSYGGRVPAIAIERLAQIKANGAIAIAVVVYGNRAYEDTLLELKGTLKQAGFQVVGGIGAIAQHSIIHQFGEHRPDAKDEIELISFAKKIKAKIDSKEYEEIQVPGNVPYREFGGVPFKPKANKKCNQCGLCASQCPMGAISKDQPALTNTDICISCMRCVSICPQQARNFPKPLLFAAAQTMKKACSSRKENEVFL